ncbi:MAG: CBS domain-containing protein [Caldilineales bacterium]
MLHKLVRTVMHNGVISCRHDATVAEVVRTLSDTDIHALVVVGDTGEAVGIVSHMDIIPHHAADLEQLTAADIMTEGVVSVSPNATVQQAIDLMLARRIHRLVVVQSQDDRLMPLGMLSTTDIVREMRGSKWTWYA